MPVATVVSSEESGGEGAEVGVVHGTPFEAPIAAVEVFRHSALVHRQGVIAPAKDSKDGRCYEIGGLPLGLVDSSVRATLDAPVDAGVVDLQVALDVQTPVEQEKLKELERFKELRRQLERLQRERRRLEQQSAALGKLVPEMPPTPKRPDRDRFATEDPLAAWLALSEFIRGVNESRLERARELTEQIRRLEDQLKLAGDELEQLSSAAVARLSICKRVLLWLGEPPTGPYEVKLSYLVPGARWFPSYELRVDEDGQSAELVVSALVAQVSGEDWKEVSVALSTADLQRRCDLPRLGAWRIGRAAAPDRHRAWRELPEDLPQLFADFDRERPSEPQPAPPPSPPHGQSIAEMISSTLSAAGIPSSSSAMALAEPEPEVAAEEELDAFSPAEITRENLEELADLAELEQEFEDEPTPTDLDDFARNAVASEPPPPPSVAPAPASAPVAGAVAHSMTPTSLLLESAAVPMQAKKKQRSVRRSKPQPRKSRPSFGAATSLVPSDELLSFSGLVLPPAADRSRGMLRPMRTEEQLPDKEDDERVRAALGRQEQSLANRLLELRTLAPPRGVRDVGESAGHFAYRYATRAPVSLPADGALHRLGVLRQDAPVKLVFRTVPSLDSAVYRVARLDNPLSVPLLAGPLDVFWGNDYLVTARLRTTAASGQLEANLGVEPRIKTARNVRHSQHEEGLLSGRTVYEESVRIEVKNGLGQKAELEVMERLPVTEERKVEVKLLEHEPVSQEYDQKDRQQPIRGGRRWQLVLGPGKAGECLLRYSVTLPSSSEIVGGGRRA